MRPWLLPRAVFALILLHGSLLGLTDDEAYYWVLAQRPALGYAYHPPAVAWLIAFFQFCFSGVLGKHSVALVRLPAALGSALILFLALQWLRDLGLKANQIGKAALLLLSFFGF